MKGKWQEVARPRPSVQRPGEPLPASPGAEAVSIPQPDRRIYRIRVSDKTSRLHPDALRREHIERYEALERAYRCGTGLVLGEGVHSYNAYATERLKKACKAFGFSEDEINRISGVDDSTNYLVISITGNTQSLVVPQNLPTDEKIRLLREFIYIPREVVEKPGAVYTKDAPPSEAAVSPPLRPPLRMQDDFDIAAKEARAERRAAAQLTGRLANYEFLASTVDLENPALALDEQRRRANRLLTAYERVQEVKQDFKDSNVQLAAARRIKQAARRERLRAKRPPAPRGRPRKAAHL